jgi:nitrogen fixation NifU-like protein
MPGRMKNPSGYGKVTGTCGKSLEIYLQITKQVIEDASYFTHDRSSTKKCGSAIAEICVGLKPDEAAQIGGDTILACLGGLPKGKVHCAFLAAEALHAALGDWEKRLRCAGSPHTAPVTARERWE